MTRKELENQLADRFEGQVYVECDQGWYDIISRLDIQIRKILPTYAILQIKEKFGGLRYYTGALTEDSYVAVCKLIDEAELEAKHTCEVCGRQGVLCRRRAWLKTLCQNCFVEWNEYSEYPAEYGVELE